MCQASLNRAPTSRYCCPLCYFSSSPLIRAKILQNGQATINEGADGLQRLDQVVAAATKYNVKLLLTLTNNWNPERPMPSSSWGRRDNSGFPRGTFANDYGQYQWRWTQPCKRSVSHPLIGGMDLYVRNFHSGGTHDDFYTDKTIINAFKNYISHVVSRYANNPTVLGWELGNDLRCSSTLPASSSCNTATITNWVADICKTTVFRPRPNLMYHLQRVSSKALIPITLSPLGKVHRLPNFSVVDSRQ